MNKQIIFIGPICVGKTTIGNLIAEALNKKSVSLDDIADEYYKENGYDVSQHKNILQNEGKLKGYQYWWPSLAYAAIKVVQDYPDSVIDFGAGHSQYQNKDLFESVKQAIPLDSYVIFLLPSPDIERSISIIKERSMKDRKADWTLDGYDFIEQWIVDECNHILADKIIYTENKTPIQCRDEILEILQHES